MKRLFSKRLLAALAALLATIAGYRVRPPSTPPEPSPETIAQWTATCDTIWREELYRDIHEDPDGLASCLDRAKRGLDAAAIRADVQASAEWAEKHAPCPVGFVRVEGRCESVAIPIARLHPDGPIFRTADGAAWRWKGVSAFALLHRFAAGENITDFLEAYRGYNVLRVWLYVPRRNWGPEAWEPPPVATIRAFLARVARDGWYVELTLLTDDDPARLPWARQLVRDLAAPNPPPNLFLEIGNEPTTHKTIDTAALRADLETSGFLFSSGDYEDSSRFFGSYLTAHTPRDAEWPRKAHDLLEYFTGGGPNATTDPAHRVPIVADEPIRPDEAPGDLDVKQRDYYAYGASCALLGAGATFHAQSTKWAQLPTDEERVMAAALLAGLSTFPADARLGAYRRIDEGQGSLRTYAMGPHMVRIRSTTLDAPEAGWIGRDPWGIAWSRP